MGVFFLKGKYFINVLKKRTKSNVQQGDCQKPILTGPIYILDKLEKRRHLPEYKGGLVGRGEFIQIHKHNKILRKFTKELYSLCQKLKFF